MKTSEMIAMLEKNPNLRFKAQNWADASVVTFLDKRLSIIDSWNGNRLLDETVLDCFRLHYDWQLVREPVPGWEAIKALNEGKSIEWHSDNDREILYFNKSDKPAWAVNFNIFFTGKWYINEQH